MLVGISLFLGGVGGTPSAQMAWTEQPFVTPRFGHALTTSARSICRVLRNTVSNTARAPGASQ
jgi:hypothetical protein